MTMSADPALALRLVPLELGRIDADLSELTGEVGHATLPAIFPTPAWSCSAPNGQRAITPNSSTPACTTRRLRHRPRRPVDRRLPRCVRRRHDRVRPTPGHTRGHQALRLELASGPVVLTADCIYFERMLDEMRVPAFAFDRDLQLRTMRDLRAMRDEGCRMLFGHDLEQFRSLPTSGLT